MTEQDALTTDAYKRLALAVLKLAARDARKNDAGAEKFINSENARVWAKVVTMLSPRQPRRYVL